MLNQLVKPDNIKLCMFLQAVNMYPYEGSVAFKYQTFKYAYSSTATCAILYIVLGIIILNQNQWLCDLFLIII